MAKTSVSGPDLRSEAYNADTLGAQLDAQARDYLANKTKGMYYDAETKTFFLSSIFDWYRADFESQGGVWAFIRKYSGRDLAHEKIRFLHFNWSLNDQ
jgi:hypothetical protein